ncbi:MAG: DUF4258 domain-containing protein [Tepidisphaeraceae bacterium]
MSATLDMIRSLVLQGAVRVSDHGYDELANDDLTVDDVLSGVADAVVVEDYPTFGKGPAVLVLQYTQKGDAIHVLWGIPRGSSAPAVLVTVYRPDPKKWASDFKRRLP